MCSYDTTEADVDRFVACLISATAAERDLAGVADPLAGASRDRSPSRNRSCSSWVVHTLSRDPDPLVDNGLSVGPA